MMKRIEIRQHPVQLPEPPHQAEPRDFEEDQLVLNSPKTAYPSLLQLYDLYEKDPLEVEKKPDPGLIDQNLLPAKIIEPGRFLTPPEYSYRADSEFNYYMRLEALEVQKSTSEHLGVKEIKEQLSRIANTRRELALYLNKARTTLHGEPIEKSLERKEDTLQIKDLINIEAPYDFSKKAVKRFDAVGNRSLGKINIDGKEMELSRLGGTSNRKILGMYHPDIQ